MSVDEYPFVPATEAQLHRCVRICQNILNLRDWEISLYTGDAAPEVFKKLKVTDACGMSTWWEDYLQAAIWLPMARIKVKNVSPFSVICHEMLHVLANACLELPRSKEVEKLIMRMEPIVYRDYLRARRRK